MGRHRTYMMLFFVMGLSFSAAMADTTSRVAGLIDFGRKVDIGLRSGEQTGQEYRNALDSLRLAVKLAPDNAEAHYWLGELIEHYRMGHPTEDAVDLPRLLEAQQHYKLAAAATPNYSVTINKLSPLAKLSTIWGRIAVYYLIRDQVDSTRWAFAQSSAGGGYDESMLEYSRNFLESCDSNAIFFANGDMDYFGLVYLQVMQSVRTDVKLINLSLLNTSRYAKFVKNGLNISISYTDFELDNLTPQLGDSSQVIRVQDLLAYNIIIHAGNQPSSAAIPVYFGISVPENNLVGYTHDRKEVDLSPFLLIEGLVYRYYEEKPKSRCLSGFGMVDAERLADNLTRRYQYKELEDSKFSKDLSFRKMPDVYATLATSLATCYLESGQVSQAALLLEDWQKKLPEAWLIDVTLWKVYDKQSAAYKLPGLVDKYLALPEDASGGVRGLLYFWHMADGSHQTILAERLARAAKERYPGDPMVKKYLGQ